MPYTPPSYSPFQWHDLPDMSTPLDSANLVAAETGLVVYVQNTLVDYDTYARAAFSLGTAPTAVKTANYTTAAGEFVPCDISGGSFTVTLPSAPSNQTRIAVKVVKTDTAHANTLTIATSGSDTFNVSAGSATWVLGALNEGAVLQYWTPLIWYSVDEIWRRADGGTASG